MVISFHKHFNRIEIHAENTNYYFDPESPLAKANDANINTPIIASLSIAGIDSSKTVFAIDNGELKSTTSSVPVLQFVLGQISALSAISRSDPTQTQLDDVIEYMLNGLPWAGADSTPPG